MECEIAAHGAPYCTRSSSKKKKKKKTTILQRDQRARKGEGRESMGRRRGKGRAGAGLAELERGRMRAPTAWNLISESAPQDGRGPLGRVGRWRSPAWIVR